MKRTWNVGGVCLLCWALLSCAALLSCSELAQAAAEKPLPKTALEACREDNADWAKDPIKGQGPVPPFDRVLDVAWDDSERDAEWETVPVSFHCFEYPRFDMPVVMEALRDWDALWPLAENPDPKSAALPLPVEEKDAHMRVKLQGTQATCTPSAPGPGYLSLHCSYWSDAGSGSGRHTIWAMSFDTTTQKHLRLQDLFTDWAKAKPILERMTREAWAEEAGDDLQSLVTTYTGRETSFVLEPQGLRMTYGYSSPYLWNYNELPFTVRELCPLAELMKPGIWPGIAPCPEGDGAE